MASYKHTVAHRLARKTDKSGDCWLWTGSIRTCGYGQIAISPGRPKPTHRVAWELEFGAIPKGLFVCHRCDNRLCIRPSHLFLGTHEDNMRDMRMKGRANNGYRKRTHCVRGHAYFGDNLLVDRRGWRKCRSCEEARSLARSASHYGRQGTGARGGLWQKIR